MHKRTTTITTDSFLRHAELAEVRKEYKKAVKFCETALAIEEAVHGPLSPHLLPIITRLLELYRHVNEQVLTLCLLDRVVEITDANPLYDSMTVATEASVVAGRQKTAPPSPALVALDPDPLM